MISYSMMTAMWNVILKNVDGITTTVATITVGLNDKSSGLGTETVIIGAIIKIEVMMEATAQTVISFVSTKKIHTTKRQLVKLMMAVDVITLDVIGALVMAIAMLAMIFVLLIYKITAYVTKYALVTIVKKYAPIMHVVMTIYIEPSTIVTQPEN